MPVLDRLVSSLPVTTGSRQLVVQLGSGGDVVPVHTMYLRADRARFILCQAETTIGYRGNEM